ncbi:TPA: HEAT repeat domain-containing protein [Pseudomonas aeruginosa]|nr:HEAT repeat domain-containing protein [Pseudomonas aeruginosa]
MDVQQVIDKLTQVLEDEMQNVWVRKGAALGLGRAGGPEARMVLARVLDNTYTNHEVRAAAAEAMGEACRG